MIKLSLIFSRIKNFWNRFRWLITTIPTSDFGRTHWVISLDHRSQFKIPGSIIFAFLWIANHASPRRLWRLMYVRNALKVPPIKPSENFRDSIWGIGLVRNEEDIIEISVRNLFNQGCEAVIVIDHNSDDLTLDLLKKMQSEFANLYIGSFKKSGHFQSFVVTKLASIARRNGAKWVIPFDADEIWVSSNMDVAQKLLNTKAGVAIADIFNCFPISDAVDYKNFRMDSHPNGKKCAIKVHKGIMIPQGNHEDLTKWRNKESMLRVVHFPWRSKSQLIRKVQIGANAEREAGLKSGAHWHWADKQSEEAINEIWTRITNGMPVPELTWTRLDESSQLLEIEWDETLGPRPPKIVH